MAIVEAYVGQPITADFWNTSHPLGEVYRTYRGSAAGPTSGATELAILRLDSMSLLIDRSYKIVASALRWDSDGATHFKWNMRYSTSGAATTSSTVLTRSEQTEDVSTGAPLIGWIRPSASATYSVLISLVRTSGTGTATTTADDENDLQLVVFDEGYAVEDTGTVI